MKTKETVGKTNHYTDRPWASPQHKLHNEQSWAQIARNGKQDQQTNPPQHSFLGQNLEDLHLILKRLEQRIQGLEIRGFPVVSQF